MQSSNTRPLLNRCYDLACAGALAGFALCSSPLAADAAAVLELSSLKAEKVTDPIKDLFLPVCLYFPPRKMMENIHTSTSPGELRCEIQPQRQSVLSDIGRGFQQVSRRTLQCNRTWPGS